MHWWLLAKELWATMHGALPEASIMDPEATPHDLQSLLVTKHRKSPWVLHLPTPGHLERLRKVRSEEAEHGPKGTKTETIPKGLGDGQGFSMSQAHPERWCHVLCWPSVRSESRWKTVCGLWPAPSRAIPMSLTSQTGHLELLRDKDPHYFSHGRRKAQMVFILSKIQF